MTNTNTNSNSNSTDDGCASIICGFILMAFLAVVMWYGLEFYKQTRTEIKELRVRIEALEAKGTPHAPASP